MTYTSQYNSNGSIQYSSGGYTYEDSNAKGYVDAYADYLYSEYGVVSMDPRIPYFALASEAFGLTGTDWFEFTGNCPDWALGNYWTSDYYFYDDSDDRPYIFTTAGMKVVYDTSSFGVRPVITIRKGIIS